MTKQSHSCVDAFLRPPTSSAPHKAENRQHLTTDGVRDGGNQNETARVTDLCLIPMKAACETLKVICEIRTPKYNLLLCNGFCDLSCKNGAVHAGISCLDPLLRQRWLAVGRWGLPASSVENRAWHGTESVPLEKGGLCGTADLPQGEECCRDSARHSCSVGCTVTRCNFRKPMFSRVPQSLFWTGPVWGFFLVEFLLLRGTVYWPFRSTSVYYVHTTIRVRRRCNIIDAHSAITSATFDNFPNQAVTRDSIVSAAWFLSK